MARTIAKAMTIARLVLFQREGEELHLLFLLQEQTDTSYPVSSFSELNKLIIKKIKIIYIKTICMQYFIILQIRHLEKIYLLLTNETEVYNFLKPCLA